MKPDYETPKRSTPRSARARLSRTRLLAALILLAVLGGATWLLLDQHQAPRPVPEETRGDEEDTSVRLQGRGAQVTEAPTGPPGSLDVNEVEDGRAGDAQTVVTGRVVDTLRRPVPGANIVVRTPGRAAVSAQADSDGRFEIAIGDPPRQELTATVMATEGGRAAWAQVSVPRRDPARVDAHTLVLGPTAELAVVVLEEDRPVAGARVSVSVVPSRQLSRLFDPRPGIWSGWALSAMTDDAGAAWFRSLPHGDARVLAQASGLISGEADVRLPASSDEPLVLHLRPARDLRVSVVLKETQAPVAGVRLRLRVQSESSNWRVPLDTPQPVPLTNAEGLAIVRGVPSDKEILIWAVGPGWTVPSILQKTVRIAPHQTQVHFEVPAGERISWEVRPGDCPAPAPGVVVPLEPSPRHRRRHGNSIDLPVRIARMEGQSLVVEGVIGDSFSALARTADGCVAELEWRRKARPSAVTFRRHGVLRVRVCDEQGAPVAGIGVYARSGRGKRMGDPVLTDRDGLAVLADLRTETVLVGIVPNIGVVERRRVGLIRFGRRDVKLSQTEQPVTFTVPALCEVVVRILVDGQPRFPRGGFRWGVLLHPETLKPHQPPNTVYDAEHGEIRFRLYEPWPKQTLKIYFSSPGFSPILQDLEILPSRAVTQAELRLDPPCDLMLKWSPQDFVRRSPPYLERLIEDSWSWFPLGSPLPSEYRRGRRVVPVSPGTYRLHSATSEAVSAAVVVSHDGPTRTLSLPGAEEGQGK